MRADLLLGTKWCSKCKTDLAVAAFGPNKRQRDGLANWCRECKATSSREWLAVPANREKARERLRRRQADPAIQAEERARSRARYHADPEKFKERHRREKLKREFGITVEQFDAMFAEQNGRCAICGTDDFQGINPHIDHCHATGVVRGLLCVRCNQGLGNFQDDPNRMRKAIAYLERFIQQLRSRAA